MSPLDPVVLRALLQAAKESGTALLLFLEYEGEVKARDLTLTEAEAEVLAACKDESQTAKQIATAAGRPCNSSLWALLRALMRRGRVVKDAGGFRLAK